MFSCLCIKALGHAHRELWDLESRHIWKAPRCLSCFLLPLVADICDDIRSAQSNAFGTLDPQKNGLSLLVLALRSWATIPSCTAQLQLRPTALKASRESADAGKWPRLACRLNCRESLPFLHVASLPGFCLS